MSTTLIFESKPEEKVLRYNELAIQLKALLDGENDEIACLANTVAAITEAFHFLWTGFYFVKDEQLVLGPFQGPIACTRIHKGKGVCGSSWAEDKTILVSDVDNFPGHIACSSHSRSEIVIPIHSKSKNVIAVLDIDSEILNFFDENDQFGLERICKMIEHHLYSK